MRKLIDGQLSCLQPCSGINYEASAVHSNSPDNRFVVETMSVHSDVVIQEATSLTCMHGYGASARGSNVGQKWRYLLKALLMK